MNEPFKVATALNHAGYEFLISDMELALTFTRIASGVYDHGHKKMRSIQNARRAYDKVRELAPKVGLTGEQQQHVDQKLDTLRSALERLGENV